MEPGHRLFFLCGAWTLAQSSPGTSEPGQQLYKLPGCHSLPDIRAESGWPRAGAFNDRIYGRECCVDRCLDSALAGNPLRRALCSPEKTRSARCCHSVCNGNDGYLSTAAGRLFWSIFVASAGLYSANACESYCGFPIRTCSATGAANATTYCERGSAVSAIKGSRASLCEWLRACDATSKLAFCFREQRCCPACGTGETV